MSEGLEKIDNNFISQDEYNKMELQDKKKYKELIIKKGNAEKQVNQVLEHLDLLFEDL